MRVWRQLRSARTSALSEEQRRLELREAQQRSTMRSENPSSAAPDGDRGSAACVPRDRMSV